MSKNVKVLHRHGLWETMIGVSFLFESGPADDTVYIKKNIHIFNRKYKMMIGATHFRGYVTKSEIPSWYLCV